MKKAKYVVLSCILFLLIAACSNQHKETINCQDNFTKQCVFELDNVKVKENSLLLVSFASIGCVQNNPKACSVLNSLLPKQPILENEETNEQKTDASSNLLNQSQEIIDSEFCRQKSKDDQDCLDFIYSLNYFIKNLTGEENASELLTTSNSQEPNEAQTRELTCYEGNLLDCTDIKSQHSSSEKKQLETNDKSFENRFSTTICFSEDEEEPNCNEYYVVFPNH